MYILELLLDEQYNIFRRVFNVVFQLAFHWIGGWILSFMFILLFCWLSVPIITIFGEDVFGTSFNHSMFALQDDLSIEKFFSVWNWYYKVAIAVGWFFPVVHLIVGDVD